MIIEIDDEIKHEIVKVVLSNKGETIQQLKNHTTIKMLIQLRNAIYKHGYNLDDFDEQAVIFELYGYKLDVNGITGYNSNGEWFSFGILYDFENFTEDIDSIYLIDQDGSDDILTL